MIWFQARICLCSFIPDCRGNTFTAIRKSTILKKRVVSWILVNSVFKAAFLEKKITWGENAAPNLPTEKIIFKKS